jgi:hypothetical protein
MGKDNAPFKAQREQTGRCQRFAVTEIGILRVERVGGALLG